MKKQFTKEQKAAYFKSLREQWQAAKKIAENGKGDEFAAIIKNHGLNVSMTGFILVYSQMKNQDLDGLPYLDAKTFMGWKENGFKVQKGQKSSLSGITWVTVLKKNDTENLGDDDAYSFSMPKEYKLFHRSQVEPIN